MSLPEPPLTGRCQCGAVAYVVTGRPETIYVCHCRECQRQSASAFGISVAVPKAHFRLERGETRCWSRTADSGRVVHCHFCPVCGSRLWHEGLHPDALTVKGGSLDQPVDLGDAIHISTPRTLPVVVIPHGATQSPEAPD